MIAISLVLISLLVSPISSDTVTIPPFSDDSGSCSIAGVEPTLQVSKEAYQPRGLAQDCEELCAGETLFNCTAYTWAGPGTMCILHGAISQNIVTQRAGSLYNLTDNLCMAEMSLLPNDTIVTTAFKTCSFEDRGVSITPPTDGHSYPYQTQQTCQHLCENEKFSSCSSFGFDNSAAPGKTNCITFRRANITTTMPSGTFRLFENHCRVPKTISLTC